MLTIATINVNGIRAAVKRGMGAWIEAVQPDVLALQEVRADDATVDQVFAGEWSVRHAACTTKGRSGVAVAARTAVTTSSEEFADGRFVGSGRWIEGSVTTSAGTTVVVCSAYVHTGQADDPDRMTEKLAFLDAVVARVGQLNDAGHHVVLAGDLNVAHDWRDIKNWKGNRGKAGFLPEEQARLDALRELGFVDLGRRFGGDGPGPYTWWSWRGKAFDNDAGWRIDYLIASPRLAELATSAEVHRSNTYAERWSDHAPLVARFDV